MKIKLIIISILLSILLFTLTACGDRSKSAVIVAGSTSVQPYAELLAEEYAMLHASDEIDVQGGGSSTGIQAASTGTADIGMSSRNLKNEELNLWHIEIAKDGLAIIVHPDNPVHNLTLAQIQDIYMGEITHWHQVGGEDHRIHIIAREDGSGTRSAFDELVMEQKRVTKKAIIQDSNGSVRQLVSLDKYAIGFISLGLVDNTTSRVKAIQIDGITASWENVLTGEYTLFRPFLFVSSDSPTGKAKDFIDYILSDIGQHILINEGLIPSGGGNE